MNVIARVSAPACANCCDYWHHNKNGIFASPYESVEILVKQIPPKRIDGFKIIGDNKNLMETDTMLH